MSLLLVHAVCPCFISILLIHLRIHTACPCWVSNLRGTKVLACSTSL
jgi:hypothetical protein